MGCRVLDANEDGAVLYCSTTMTAFGPVFNSAEHAEDFVRWLNDDPRHLSAADLEASYSKWLDERCDEDGDLRDEYQEALAEFLYAPEPEECEAE